MSGKGYKPPMRQDHWSHDRLETNYDDLYEAYENDKDQAAKLMKDGIQLKVENSQLKERTGELEHENKNLKDENDQLKKDNGECKKHKDQLQATNNDLKTKNDRLGWQLAEKVAMIEEMAEENRREPGTWNDARLASTEQDKEQIKILQSRLQDLETQLKDCRDHVQRYDTPIGNAPAKTEHNNTPSGQGWTDKTAPDTPPMDDFDMESPPQTPPKPFKAPLDPERHWLTHIRALESDNLRLLAELTEQGEKLDKSEYKLQHCGAHRQQLEDQNRDMKEHIAHLISRLEELEKELKNGYESLEVQLAQLNSDYEDMKKAKEEGDKDCKALGLMVKQLQTAGDDLKQDREDSEKAREENEKVCKEMEEQMQHLRDEFSRAVGRLRALGQGVECGDCRVLRERLARLVDAISSYGRD